MAGVVRVSFCLFLECSEATMEERLLERGKTSGRVDDNSEAIKKRFRTYVNDTMPIIQHFRKIDKCCEVDSSLTKEEVYKQIQGHMNPVFGKPLPRAIFVLGGPGAGKGTQCANLVNDYGFTHISAGDCLRAERKNPNSKDGELINNYIKEGKIVPVEITLKLLKIAMQSSGNDRFLIDGFPRNSNNLDGWNKAMAGVVRVSFCLFLECSEATMEERLLERGKTSGRVDDNSEAIKKRFRTYVNDTMPIIQHCRKIDKCCEVDSSLTKEEVYKQIQGHMNPVFGKPSK